MRLLLVTSLTVLTWMATACANSSPVGQEANILERSGDTLFPIGPIWSAAPEASLWTSDEVDVAVENNRMANPSDMLAGLDEYLDLAEVDFDCDQAEGTTAVKPAVDISPLDDVIGSEFCYDGHSDAEHAHQFHTSGAPVPGDGAVYFEFPDDPPTRCEEAINFFPDLLTYPQETLGNCWSKVLGAQRDELHTELDEEPIGIQFVPPRPPLLVEWNELFLGPGELAAGREFGLLGPVWRPAVWVWGEFRSAVQYYDNGTRNPVFESANRLDLFTQLNLSGTERILFGFRPLDRENSRGTAREFAGYDFRNAEWLDGLNFQPNTLFFEGDFGEIFPMLDPYDSRFLDIGFSVGRMPLLAQQGLLIAEDMIDAVTVTRNTLNNGANLNRRITGVYSWGEINRNSAVAPNPGAMLDENSQMFALLTETDYFRSTINADVAYVTGDDVQGDMIACGLSGIQRHYLHHNTFNTSVHLLASFPTDKTTPYAGQGELLFAQTSWTPHHYYDLIYVNGFLAIDQFTSPARGPVTASPLGLTGINFAPVALGRSGPPMAIRTNDIVGGAIGYQWFFCDTRQQLIWETGGAKEHSGPAHTGVITTALRYQSAHGQHSIFVLDGFVGKQEAREISAGGRVELRVKF